MYSQCYAGIIIGSGLTRARGICSHYYMHIDYNQLQLGPSLLCSKICPLCFLAFPNFLLIMLIFMLPKYTFLADYGEIDQEKSLLDYHSMHLLNQMCSDT